jgi:micrococcal nuclease
MDFDGPASKKPSPLARYWAWTTGGSKWRWTPSIVVGFFVFVIAMAIAFPAEEEATPETANADAPQVVNTTAAQTTAVAAATGTTAPRKPTATPPAPAASSYVVKSGDSLGAICAAQVTAMSSAECIASIVSANRLTGPDQLAVGQSLVLPAGTPGTSSTAPTAAPTPQPGMTTAVVARVIDGDTVELQDGSRLRYIGVDTPETVDPGRPVGCFGPEASARNKALVLGKTVQLEKDVSETDRYGRLLRYVYLDGVMINEQLVAEGYAMSSTYPPDVKYQARFVAAQQAAQAADKGLWGGCESEAPATVPTTAPTVSPTVAPTQPASGGGGGSFPAVGSDCPASAPIKGNANSGIYHMPGQQAYDRTIPEECFATEADAQAAGYRRAQR